jgi:predicted RNA-binding protein with PIN domain
MSLHIIIDGYNLIRQSASLSALENQDLQLGRDTLIKMLVAYKKIKRHKITIVFDGTHAPGYLDRRDRSQGITVTYSRQGETADTVIKGMAAREKEKALVVSSDREIAEFAAASQAAVISSPEFEERVAMAGYMEMKGGSVDEGHSGWEPTTRKKGPRRRLSKKDRKNRSKVKKL